MKKIILVGFTVLLALALVTCDDMPGSSQKNDIPFVEYSADGSRVTINLDGYGDAESARALSRPIAREGYNFLEVVFRDSTTIARSSWEKGKAMNITGVPRGATPAGVNYGVTGGATLSATVGEAVLFVGQKVGSDLTLLAVGKIVAIDGVDVTALTANITPSTRSVTFGLAALTGNTTFVSATNGGSFAAVTPAEITISQMEVITGLPQVTVYQLTSTVPTADVTRNTTYTLGSSAPTDFPIAQMVPGIVSRFPPATVPEVGGWSEGFVLTEPLYKLANGETRGFNAYKAALVSGEFGAALVNNTAIPAVLPIIITIPADAQGVTSFFFSIPVVANTAADSNVAGSTVVPANTWLVRPGVDVYSLDDGTANSIGSAIFLSASLSPLDTINIGIK